MTQVNVFTKQKQTDRFQKQTYGYQRRKTAGRDKLGAWDYNIHATRLSRCGSVVMSQTSVHEDVGLIPGLAQ